MASLLKDYLLNRIQIDLKTGCWNWTLSKSGNRYGAAWFEGKKLAAHRASYEIFVGPIPKGLNACHKCDNSICINPHHIFIGTQKENIDDCRKKGRFGLDIYYKNGGHLGRRNGVGPWLKGEDHGQAKLTNAQALEILSLLSNKVKQKVIAKEFGVDQSTVSDIKTKKTLETFRRTN